MKRLRKKKIKDLKSKFQTLDNFLNPSTTDKKKDSKKEFLKNKITELKNSSLESETISNYMETKILNDSTNFKEELEYQTDLQERIKAHGKTQ